MLVGLLLMTIPAWALPYTAGPYLVDVAVYNRTWHPIPDAGARVRLGKDRIIVRAWSPGYVARVKELGLPAGSAVLKADMVLEDREKEITITDLNGETIESAYLQTDQYGFSPDTFGVEAFIPRENWTEPSTEGVEIFDERWRLIDSRKKIEIFDEFYKVTFIVPRRELDRSMNEWYLVVATELEPSEQGAERWISLYSGNVALPVSCGSATAGREGDLDESRSRFARFLAHSFNRALQGMHSSGVLPPDLERLLSERHRFDALHERVPGTACDSAAIRGFGGSEYFPGYGYGEPGYKYRKGRELSREEKGFRWQDEEQVIHVDVDVELVISLDLLPRFREMIPAGRIRDFQVGEPFTAMIDGQPLLAVKVKFTASSMLRTVTRRKYEVNRVWFELLRAQGGIWNQGPWETCGQTYVVIQEPTGEYVTTSVRAPPRLRPPLPLLLPFCREPERPSPDHLR